MKNRGFTLIELLVVVTIIYAIILTIAIGSCTHKKVETFCHNGYLWNNESGNPVMVVDHNGFPMECK